MPMGAPRPFATAPPYDRKSTQNGRPVGRVRMGRFDRGRVKTRLLMSVAQQSALNDLVPIRKIRHAGQRQHDIAHCRYGTTFSHNLDQLGQLDPTSEPQLPPTPRILIEIERNPPVASAHAS